jgi:hypothetical protein
VWFFGGTDDVKQKIHQGGVAFLAQVCLAVAVCDDTLSAFSVAIYYHGFFSFVWFGTFARACVVS